MRYTLKNKNNNSLKKRFKPNKLYLIHQMFNPKSDLRLIHEQTLLKKDVHFFRVSIKNSFNFLKKTPFNLLTKLSCGSLFITELGESSLSSKPNKSSCTVKKIFLSDFSLICAVYFNSYYFEKQLLKIYNFDHSFSNKLLVNCLKQMVRHFYYNISK